MKEGGQASLDVEIQALQEAALRSEVDISLLLSNLAATPAERLRRHDRILAFLLAARSPTAARQAEERRAAEETE
jgi:hypothetical protein